MDRDTIHPIYMMRLLGVGMLGGLLATLVISALIFAGEAMMGYPHGLFYLIIGDALGLDSAGMGMLMHLLSGTLIGLVASIPIALNHRMLLLLSRFNASLIYGLITGILVWLLFFIPVSYTLVMPVLEGYNGTVLDRSGKIIEGLETLFSKVICSAVGLHIQYGIIYSIVVGAYSSRVARLIHLES